MAVICDKYKNGFCQVEQAHVPESWCKTRCRKDSPPDIKPAKHKPLTLAKRFVDAMRKWQKAGYPTVSRQVWRARLAECKKCDTKLQCPICGCQIHAKALLATEQCPMGKWQ